MSSSKSSTTNDDLLGGKYMLLPPCLRPYFHCHILFIFHKDVAFIFKAAFTIFIPCQWTTRKVYAFIAIFIWLFYALSIQRPGLSLSVNKHGCDNDRFISLFFVVLSLTLANPHYLQYTTINQFKYLLLVFAYKCLFYKIKRYQHQQLHVEFNLPTQCNLV